MNTDDQVTRSRNPREQASIFSLTTFFYTKELFTRGFKKDLEDDDLHEVVKACQSKKCGDKIEHAYKEEKRINPSSIRIIWNVFGLRYIGLGILHLMWKLGNSIMEPEAISKLVAFFKPGQTNMTLYDVLYFAGIMTGLKLLHCFYFQNYLVYLNQLAIQIRTSFCSAIYRKALRLSPRALQRVSLGNIVTLITKDVLQFESSIWLFNDLWISIIQTLVTCYLIYNKIGLSSTIGVLVLLSYMPVQVYVSRMIKNMRLNINRRTDNRLQITQETLSTIKIIKMYTWEKIFSDRIGQARRKEMKAMMKTVYSKIALMASSILVSKIGFYVLIMAYIWLKTDVSAADMFYIMKCFGTLRHTISISFSMGFSRIAELAASLHRIDIILSEEEISEHFEKPDDHPQIELKNVSLELHKKGILKNINLKLETGLTVLTGQLGCGKSSLIKLILRDYPIDEGELRERGKISYASQEPWLFPASIKQNILFGEKFHHKRYEKVIEVCALKYDLSVLEKGDETIVADRGLNLSKGQQARVNLARAVYRDSDIYLIDDALTALDSRVQEHIFNNCIKGFLKGKLVVLVTHNAQHMAKADKIVILEDGKVKFEGKQREFSKSILETIEEDFQEKPATNHDKVDEEISEKSKLLGDKVAKRHAVYHEVKKEGSVDFEIYSSYISSGGGIILFIFIVLAFFGSTFTDSGSHKILTNWINQQQELTILREKINSTSVTELPLLTSGYTPSTLSNMTSSSLTMNNLTNTNFSSTNLEDARESAFLDYQRVEMIASKTLNMFTILTILSTVLDLVKSYLVLRFSVSASINLHRKMISSVVYSVMAFFDNFFIGNILNRFSQDLNVIDEQLPFQLSHMISTAFHLAGTVGLIATVDWKFLIPSVVVIIILVIMRFVYIPTARSLKRLEAATRSPLVGHLNSSIEGMTTIRAFKAQNILKDEFDKYQDLYTSAYYSSLLSKRAFAFYMDLTTVIFISYVVMKFLFGEQGTSAGNVGLTLSQVAGLATVVQHGLVQWSTVENLMTSVERVSEYTKLEPEKKTGDDLKQWPNKGQINYTNVALTYTNSHEKVLKDINFSLTPTEKIGIIGRTGAGKSSIISTLFRLYEYEGQIVVDGVEIKSLPLKFLREHISIIPQDPIIFSGTVRDNVDPFGKYADEDIWKTLNKIQLGSVVSNLDCPIEEINFSTGQIQLICVARAIIKNNKIVVLDEATANMDPETENMIQKTIDANFSDCTVLIIAHRLQSILNCSRVMVLDRGKIVEFDNPMNLVENKNSLFSLMLRNAGIDESSQG